MSWTKKNGLQQTGLLVLRVCSAVCCWSQFFSYFETILCLVLSCLVCLPSVTSLVWLDKIYCRTDIIISWSSLHSLLVPHFFMSSSLSPLSSFLLVLLLLLSFFSSLPSSETRLYPHSLSIRRVSSSSSAPPPPSPSPPPKKPMPLFSHHKKSLSSSSSSLKSSRYTRRKHIASANAGAVANSVSYYNPVSPLLVSVSDQNFTLFFDHSYSEGAATGTWGLITALSSSSSDRVECSNYRAQIALTASAECKNSLLQLNGVADVNKNETTLAGQFSYSFTQLGQGQEGSVELEITFFPAWLAPQPNSKINKFMVQFTEKQNKKKRWQEKESTEDH